MGTGERGKSLELNVGRLAFVSFAGAFILEILLIFATGPKSAFTIRQVPSHLTALLVGALGGWLFELFRELMAATRETLEVAADTRRKFETFAARINYQDEALAMLLRSPRHNDVLTRLIQVSIGDNFKKIPLIGPPEYLDFLRRAIAHSDTYDGIQRKPLRWFMNTGGAPYLIDLNQRNMSHKIRLFVIDEPDLVQWKEDLGNDACCRYYWENTGDVTTYWMTTGDFLSNFPNFQAAPPDLALYDRQLLISYDEQLRILSFDVVGDKAAMVRLFDSIGQMSARGDPDLHTVPKPASPELSMAGGALRSPRQAPGR